MPMRDYEDLKNLKIPAEQERIMDIIRMRRNTPCFSYGDISHSPFV